MNSNTHFPKKALMFVLMLVSASVSYADSVVLPDNPTVVEAYIQQHKIIAQLMSARSSTEAANQQLHDALAACSEDFQIESSLLDKYDKAFDAMQVIADVLQTIFTIKEVATDVSSTLSDYKKLVDDYVNIIKAHGVETVRSEDEFLVETARQCISNVYSDTSQILLQIAELVAYAKSKRKMTIVEFNTIVEILNTNMMQISCDLYFAYSQSYKYMQYRKSYLKDGIDHIHPRDAARSSRICLQKWNIAGALIK